MKTAISLPDNVFRAAERIQRRKRISRSEFYANAIKWYIEREENKGITEQLNIVYSDSVVDKVFENVESAAINDLPENDWK